MLHVKDYALTLTGGIVLFLVALSMIFTVHDSDSTSKIKQEPFIVPIATPILSGSGLMAIIMLYARQEANDWKVTGAILLAWIGVFAVMASAPYLQKVLGKRGLTALEQLMGMILALMSMQMIVNGASIFIKTL